MLKGEPGNTFVLHISAMGTFVRHPTKAAWAQAEVTIICPCGSFFNRVKQILTLVQDTLSLCEEPGCQITLSENTTSLDIHPNSLVQSKKTILVMRMSCWGQSMRTQKTLVNTCKGSTWDLQTQLHVVHVRLPMSMTSGSVIALCCLHLLHKASKCFISKWFAATLQNDNHLVLFCTVAFPLLVLTRYAFRLDLMLSLYSLFCIDHLCFSWT